VIRYGIPGKSYVEIEVYSILGQQVITIVRKVLDAGYHETKLDASQLSGGVYLYRMKAGDYIETRKLLYLK
jgi:hypothetical protein